jgi:uncharacterized membrane protein YdbT with pleckstrin-like domain
MDKNEFMSELRQALKGMVPDTVYEDTVKYYEDYFENQKNLGFTEKEICKKLGSARLIAKTIIDTKGQGYGGEQYDYEKRETARERRKREKRFSCKTLEREERKASRRKAQTQDHVKGWHINMDEYGNMSLAYGKLDFSTTQGKVILAILAVLAVIILVCLIVGIFWIGMSVAVYVIVPAIIILVVINVFVYLFGGGE